MTQTKYENTAADIFYRAYDDLTEPAAIILAYEDECGEFGQCDENVNSLVEALKKENIKACSYKDEEAMDVSTTLVTPSGIQTPFTHPKKLREYTQTLINVLNRHPTLYLSAFPTSKTIKQMTAPKKIIPYEAELIKEYPRIALYKHPNSEAMADLYKRHGKEFDKDLLNEALNNAHNDTLRDEKYFNYTKLFRGVSTAIPDLTNTETENRSYAYLSLYRKMAIRHPIVKGNYNCSFIHLHRNSDKNLHFGNFGLETGKHPELELSKMHETFLLLPHNTHLETYINFNAEKYFLIPKDKEIWQAYIKLTEPMMHPNHDVEIARRNDQLSQALKNNGRPLCYDLGGKQHLGLITNINSTDSNENRALILLTLSGRQSPAQSGGTIKPNDPKEKEKPVEKPDTNSEKPKGTLKRWFDHLRGKGKEDNQGKEVHRSTIDPRTRRGERNSR